MVTHSSTSVSRPLFLLPPDKGPNLGRTRPANPPRQESAPSFLTCAALPSSPPVVPLWGGCTKNAPTSGATAAASRQLPTPSAAYIC